MLKLHTLVLGDHQTNTYIVHHSSSRNCVIIDPGYEPQVILDKVSALGLTVEAILLTHGHFDHVGAVDAIVDATGCALWMSERDYHQCTDPITAHYYPIANGGFTEFSFFEDSEQIHAGGLTFTVLTTPGHTQGSVCFLCEDALFSGDTLFAGSCGRSDLPGGDWRTIQKSLRRLSELEGNFTVYPGHGESTTLAKEKQYNPYLR